MAANDRNESPKANDPEAPPVIRGEKLIPGTTASVPVDPPDVEADDLDIEEPAAVDHRKQFTGSDDHRGTGGAGA